MDKRHGKRKYEGCKHKNGMFSVHARYDPLRLDFHCRTCRATGHTTVAKEQWAKAFLPPIDIGDSKQLRIIEKKVES